MSPDSVPAAFEWSVHPFMESRARAVLSVAAPLLVAALVHLWMHAWLWTVLALALLGSAEVPFFLKTAYRFDADGVSLRRAGVAQAKKWDQLKTYYPDRNGVLLSPFARPYWLENFRGIYLQYGRHREAVLAQLERRLGPAYTKPAK